MQSGFDDSSYKPEEGPAPATEHSSEAETITEQSEAPIEDGEQSVEAGSIRPNRAELWPRPPFYLRFPAILAGPLLVAVIVWFGSGSILSATIAPSEHGISATQAVATIAKAQATVASASPTAIHTPSATAVAAPAPTTAVATSTATPASTPTAAPTPFPLAVANTGGDGVFLNRTPAPGDRIKGWPDRTILQVIGEDRIVAGQRWKYVRDPDGNDGWVPAQYLVDPSSLPAPTATPTPVPPTPMPTATAEPMATPTPAATATRLPSPTNPPTATPTAHSPAAPSSTAEAAAPTPRP